jgi:RNA polymerase sigma-70 factor (ECF subfamily)
MPRIAEELLPTRATLLQRLKDWQDESSWQQFFDTYWKLIYGVARQAGLSDVEAQDVVQETMLAAAKHLPGFKYDPAIGSFKAWLLKMTRWRIADQLRKRVPLSPQFIASSGTATTTGTDFIKRVPDPAGASLDGVWDAEWQINLLEAAMANVKSRIDPEKYQIFDCYVNKGWPPEKVAQTFNVPISQVYLAKHRVTELIREEVARLEKEMA